MSRRTLFLLSLIIFVSPALSPAAQIDEIAYLTSKELKTLSTKAVALITSPSLGVCGRRREMKITDRGIFERWPEIIQSAIKRSGPYSQVVHVQPVGKSTSSLDSAVNHLLSGGGYRPDPSETDEAVKAFKIAMRACQNNFQIYSGQIRGVDSGHTLSFLALADEKQNEALIVSLGEDLCR